MFDYDYEETLEDKGLMRIDDMPDIDHATDHFIGVIECLYGKRDIADLEWHLEEVGYILKVELPNVPLQVERIKTMQEKYNERLYIEQVGYTRAMSDFLRGAAV